MTEDLIIYRKTIPAREPEYADFPEKLHPDIVKFLKNHGIEKLYIHQTEAYEQAAEGKNLVITTPTASGKSLCFYLPVIDAILKEPLTRALFVYPTKALATDQYRALLPWIEFFGRERLDARSLRRRYFTKGEKPHPQTGQHHSNQSGDAERRDDAESQQIWV